MKRQILGTAAAVLAAVSLLPGRIFAISAGSYLVRDPVGSRVLMERQAERKSLIASTTKIMTGLIVCEQCNVLEPVRIPKEAVGIEGSSLYLKEGEVLTVQELLYGMMLRSGNDAATALAIHCAGSVEAFAGLMNRKAAELRMNHSHFENPHGLDGRHHYSTAGDLGILGEAAMKNPIFAKTVSTKAVRIGSRQLKNHNKLLWRLEGAEGIKTGYTKAAGRILVSSASRMGRRIIAVTLNAPDDWNDHRILLDRAFKEIHPRHLIRKGQQVGMLEVAGGNPPQVPIVANADFILGARDSERADVILPGPGFLYPPVQTGQMLGEAWVLISGSPVGKIPVSCGKSSGLEIKEQPTLWNRIFGGIR